MFYAWSGLPGWFWEKKMVNLLTVGHPMMINVFEICKQ